MELYPAIDLRGGRCVRLLRGDYGRETVYGDDPVAQARAFESAGVGWIHVVDLDAARSGVQANLEVIAAISSAVDAAVQAGGGVRSVESAEALFAAGVKRVVVGTAAVDNPDFVRELAARRSVAVGLDSKSGMLSTEGWLTQTGRSTFAVAEAFATSGVDAFVVTDINRDGTLAGPDLAGLAEMLAATGTDVIASGGVSSHDDLATLAALRSNDRRLAGAIVGTAIYEGRVDVARAVAEIAGTRRPS